MTIQELSEKMSLTCLVPGDSNREVTGGYCGDLLSWVMGRASEGDAWFTVMGNINAIAVATLADVACIILVEDVVLDEDASNRASQQQVAVYQSSRTAYELAGMLHTLLPSSN